MKLVRRSLNEISERRFFIKLFTPLFPFQHRKGRTGQMRIELL